MNKLKITVSIIIILIVLFLCTSYKLFETSFDKNGLINLINNTRTENGLSALALDENLLNLAQSRADDMIKRNYFSHYTPEGNRVSCGEILFWGCVEIKNEWKNDYTEIYPSCDNNLIINYWLNSEPHRNIILNKNYKRVGVGFASDNNYLKIVVLFSSK